MKIQVSFPNSSVINKKSNKYFDLLFLQKGRMRRLLLHGNGRLVIIFIVLTILCLSQLVQGDKEDDKQRLKVRSNHGQRLSKAFRYDVSISKQGNGVTLV